MSQYGMCVCDSVMRLLLVVLTASQAYANILLVNKNGALAQLGERIAGSVEIN